MKSENNIKPEDTKLFSLYVYELWWLANGVKQKTEHLFAETKFPDEENIIQVSPELHSIIASTLSDAANLKKLLVTKEYQLKGESGRQFRLRLGRTQALANLLEGVALNELLNAKVRNTLEHFDEYLDEANLAVTEAKKPPSPMAAYNMILSHWDVFNPRMYPIRVYISEERKFYNMKWSVDLGAMNTEAKAVIERLAQFLGVAKDGPGGLMLPLT